MISSTGGIRWRGCCVRLRVVSSSSTLALVLTCPCVRRVAARWNNRPGVDAASTARPGVDTRPVRVMARNAMVNVMTAHTKARIRRTLIDHAGKAVRGHCVTRAELIADGINAAHAATIARELRQLEDGGDAAELAEDWSAYLAEQHHDGDTLNPRELAAKISRRPR